MGSDFAPWSVRNSFEERAEWIGFEIALSKNETAKANAEFPNKNNPNCKWLQDSRYSTDSVKYSRVDLINRWCHASFVLLIRFS